MAGFDPNVLSAIITGPRPVQVPDMVETQERVARLSQLANISKLQQMQLEQREREAAATRGVNDGFGQITDINDNHQVLGVFQKLPSESRVGFLKAIQDAREKDAEIGYKRSQTRKLGVEADAKGQDMGVQRFNLFGQMAGGLAKEPTRENWLAAKANAQRMGFDPAILDVPEGMEPTAYFSTLAEQSMTRAQQMEVRDRGLVRAETGRHNVATEGHQASTLQETMRNNQAGRNVQWAQLGEQRRHNTATEAGAAAERSQGKAPPGYRWKPDGTLEPIPGGPSDPRGKQGPQSERALDLIAQAETLLPDATGSYAGAALDEASRAFGATTAGAQANAQLKVLQGHLMFQQPRMEGPQSDKDTALYRQMVGDIGDQTIPVAQRQAALKTIRSLHEKYAGVAPKETSKPPALSAGQQLQSLPDAASVPVGTVIRHSESGVRYRSDGRSWKTVRQ